MGFGRVLGVKMYVVRYALARYGHASRTVLGGARPALEQSVGDLFEECIFYSLIDLYVFLLSDTFFLHCGVSVFLGV